MASYKHRRVSFFTDHSTLLVLMFVQARNKESKALHYWSFVLGIWQRASNGPLARYVKLRVAHAPGMPGTFSPPAWVNDPDMHHGTCVTHVPWCMPGSLTCGFLWSWCREKPSRHSRRMRNPQFYVSGKRPMRKAFLCHEVIVTYAKMKDQMKIRRE